MGDDDSKTTVDTSEDSGSTDSGSWHEKKVTKKTTSTSSTDEHTGDA